MRCNDGFKLDSDIVSLLLEHGADPYESDIAGNDPLMFASMFGRTDNVKFWLKRFPDWDLERKNKVVGGVALGHAVYMGPHRLELVKFFSSMELLWIIEQIQEARFFTALCSSEDCDPELLELSSLKNEK